MSNTEKIIIILIVIGLAIMIGQLAGCSTVPTIVKVPIAEPCIEIKPAEGPETPLKKLNDKSTIAEVVKAYAQEARNNKARILAYERD